MSTRPGHSGQWVKRGIQLPTAVVDAYDAITKKAGHGEVKLVASAAAGLIAGMPQEVRGVLTEFVFRNRTNPGNLTPASFWAVFESAMREHGHWPCTTPPAVTRNEGGGDDEYCPRTVLRNPIKRRTAG